MITIDRAILTRIKEAVSLPKLVSEYVEVRRSGREYLILCLNHEEKNPSCRVYEDHCWCYTCNTRVDAFRFLMLVTGCTFMEAATQLSERTGISLDGVRVSPRQRAYDATEMEFSDWWWRRKVDESAVRLSLFVRLLGRLTTDAECEAAGLRWRRLAALKAVAKSATKETIFPRRALCDRQATEEDREAWVEWKAEVKEMTEIMVEVIACA